MYTIVVADDEEELRKAIIRNVDWESIGFLVVGEAENGIEALELVEQKEPDLLLTDIRMPFISGIELARQVREVRPTTRIAFLSGFDDFTYAQRAIQYNIISYMLKPITITDLTAELHAIRNKLDKQFEEFHSIRQTRTDTFGFVVPLLLNGYCTDNRVEREEKLREQAVACGLFPDHNNAFQYVIMITTVRVEGRNNTVPDMVHSIDMILKKYVKFYSFYTEGYIISLLIATRTSFEKYLHIIVGDIIQSMERILNLRCDIGISRMEERLADCHEAYRDAMNAHSYSGQEESSVHYIADEERAAAFDMSKVPDMITDMENLIRGGTEQELNRYVDEMLEKLRGEIGSQVKVKFLLAQLIASVCRTVYAVADKADAEKLLENPLIQRMAFFDGSFQEMKEQFISLCQMSRELVVSGRKKSSDILCDQTLQIIEKDFADPDLSLVSVSGRINVSPNYLSALIKRQSGQSFVDILTGKRIETARELLLCSPMKIREISERCGYSDQHYFSYCFKKRCGISPKALRQQMKTAE